MDIVSSGRAGVYLDSNATTPVDNEVITVITAALRNDWGNPSSCYETGERAKAVIAESRKYVADAINASSSDIIFVSGGTEANNWVIATAIKHFKKIHSEAGDGVKPHIVTTTVDHDAILVPLLEYERKGTIDSTFVRVNQECECITAEDIVQAIRPNTCLVTVMMANNETGTIMPIKEISEKIRRHSADVLIHTDAAQALGKIHVDVSMLGVDYLTIVGHKCYGPRIGALYARNLGKQNGVPLYPLFYGGVQEQSYRPGTENTPMIVGLGRAAYISAARVEQFAQNMSHTRDYLEKRLHEEFGDKVVFNCTKAPRLPNTSSVAFLGADCEGYKLVQQFKKVRCSTGSACHSNECKPSKVLLNFHVPPEIAANSIRLSTGRYTSIEEIDDAVREIAETIRKRVSS